MTYPDPNQYGYDPNQDQQPGYEPGQPQNQPGYNPNYNQNQGQQNYNQNQPGPGYNQGYQGQPGPGYNQGYQGQPQGGYQQGQGYANQGGYQSQGYQGQPQGGYQNQGQPQGPQVGLSDFLKQPAVGFGTPISTKNFFKAPGQSLTMQVARDVTGADVRLDLDGNKQPRAFPDGRPKTVLVIPAHVPEMNGMFPGGAATLWAKGQLWSELLGAMNRAGVPPRPIQEGSDEMAVLPEDGARINVTLMGKRDTGGSFQPANVWQVLYWRPQDGSAPPIGPGQGGAQGYGPPQGQYQQGPAANQYPQQTVQYQQGPSQGQEPQGAYQPAHDQYAQQAQYQGQPQGNGQQYGMQSPAAQVEYATAQAVQAAQAAPQQGAQPQPSYNQPAGGAPQDQGQPAGPDEAQRAAMMQRLIAKRPQ